MVVSPSLIIVDSPHFCKMHGLYRAFFCVCVCGSRVVSVASFVCPPAVVDFNALSLWLSIYHIFLFCHLFPHLLFPALFASLVAAARDHLAKRDLWGLTELWQTCEMEAKKTSGNSHVSCRIYESRLDLLRQEVEIVAGPTSRNRPSSESFGVAGSIVLCVWVMAAASWSMLQTLARP